MRRAAYLVAALLAVVILLLPLVGAADPGDRATGSITPSLVQSGVGQYTLSIANLRNSPDDLTQATVAIPSGFVLDALPTPVVTGCSGSRAWTATADPTTITLAAATAGDALCDGGTVSLTISVLSAPGDGSYTWTTTAPAPFAVVSQPTLTIDATAPDTTIATRPVLTVSTVSFSFSGADGSGSGVTGFECSLDGSGFTACLSPKGYAGLGDGGHTFAVRAVDAAGNVDPSPDSVTWTVDSTPPETQIDGGPSGLVASRSASFTFSGSDSGSGVSRYECDLDGSGFSTCSSGVGYDGLSDGSHTFSVRAIDVAGNVDSSPAQRTWSIDATPPASPTLGSVPANPSGVGTWTFTFTGEAGAHFSCQLDGGGFGDCSSGSYTTPALPDGSHTFGVKAIDDAGNESGVAGYTWSIDTVSPLVVVSDAPPQLTNQTTASFSFAANKAGSTYLCSLDGADFASCSSPKLYRALGDGAHTFAVRATSLGHVGPASTYTWTIDTVAPQTTIASTPPAASHSSTATFAFGSSEAESTFTCQLDGGGPTPCTSPKTYTGLRDGSHRVSVQAVDKAGNADPSPATFSWSITNGGGGGDVTPPHNVSGLRASVRYGFLQLTWKNPTDVDFDHVGVFVAGKGVASARRLLYAGRQVSYVDRRFKNGEAYRFLVVSYDHTDLASTGASKTVASSVLLGSPRDGSVVSAPPVLRWAAVPRATFYNVQLWRGPEQKVLSSWPRTSHRALQRSWLYGRRQFLRAGVYTWYVWPAFGPRARPRYGQLLGQATFRVR